MAVQLVTGADTHLINAQNTSKLNLTMSTVAGASTSFSVNVWIKANWGSTAAGVGRISLVGIYGPSPNPTSALQIGGTLGNGDLACWTWGGGVLVRVADDFMVPYNNVWVNVGYTYNGTTHRLYVDGLEVANSTAAQAAGNLQLVTINGYPGGGASETYNHIVDSYALWNRVLSPSEMSVVYYAFGARHSIVNGQVAGYEFDEGTEGSNVGAASVIDTAGNGLTLLLTGAGTAPKYTYTTSFATANIRTVQIQ